MTPSEALQTAYGWADGNAGLILAVAVAIPVVGTVAALIGRGGRTDADGKFIASAFIGLALLVAGAEMLSIWFAHSVLSKSIMDANTLLLVAPVLCLVGTMAGIRWVFPLNQLASVRSAADIGMFLGAAGVAIWLFSTFRGWGIVFFGSLLEMFVLLALGLFLLWRLYGRAVR